MTDAPKNSEISLKDLILKFGEWWSFLKSKWMVIVATCLIGGALGLWYASKQKLIYTAKTTFALEEEASSSGGAAGLASQLGIDVGGGTSGAFKGATVMELFKTRFIIQQVLLSPFQTQRKILSFADAYINANELRSNWKDKRELSKISFPINSQKMTRLQDSILGVIYGNIVKSDLSVAQADKKVGIIGLEFRSFNEDFAKEFSEILLDKVSDFYIETKSKKSRDNLLILEGQVDSVRVVLSSSVSGAAVAADQTFGLNPALNVRRVPSVRKEIDIQTNSSILSELVKQMEMARINVRKETPLVQIIDRPILPLESKKFGKLKGIVLGVLLAVFLTVSFLIFRRVYKGLIS